MLPIEGMLFAVVGLVLLAVLFFAFVIVAGGVVFAVKGRPPRMKRWQTKVMKDKVNRHLRDKAEAEVVQMVVEAAGYETTAE